MFDFLFVVAFVIVLGGIAETDSAAAYCDRCCDRLRIQILLILKMFKIHEFLRILKCHKIFKIKFAVMSYITGNWKTSLTCTPTRLQTKLKPEESSIIVLSRVLSNKHAVRNCVQLELRDFKSSVTRDVQKRILTNFQNLVKFVNFYEF